MFQTTVQFGPTPPDRFQAIKDRRKPIKHPCDAVISRYRNELQELAHVLPTDQVLYTLEGGMALAMHVGKFLRCHSDVDVGVFLDQLPQFEECLKQNGYRLFSRNSIMKPFEYTRYDLLKSVTAKQIKSRFRVKRLMAMKVDRRGRVDWNASVLSQFDIHIHRRDHRSAYLTYSRFAFPLELFEQYGTARTSQGLTLRLASLHLIYFFKLLGHRPAQKFDLNVIEERRLVSLPEAQRIRSIVANNRRRTQRCRSESQ